jgi:calcium/calmodulin-dependent protein kinase I
MSSDIKHWHLNATVYKDRVEEIHFISDPARNVRRKQQRQIWAVEQFLGRGGFGEVSLQRNNEAGKARAVKRIAGAAADLNQNEFEKELRALLEFSKPKVNSCTVPFATQELIVHSTKKPQYLWNSSAGLRMAMMSFWRWNICPSEI